MLDSHISRLQWTAPRNDAVTSYTDPGLYQLYLRLPDAARLEIGRLGVFDFPEGLYVYTGSALRGIGARVARHLRTEKRRRWHIDYLLEHARVEAVAVLPTDERLECDLHRYAMLCLQGRIVALGFGASDCRCSAHLGYLGRISIEELGARYPA